MTRDASAMPRENPPRPPLHNIRAGVKRIARRVFSREYFSAAMKTALWLVPVTVLIWIFAERAQVTDPQSQSVPIAVTSNDPTRFVSLRLPGNDHSIVATVTGPRAAYEQWLRDIQPNGDSPAVVIAVDPSLPLGQTTQLDAGRELSTNPIFQRNGISIKSCQPARLPVFVDELVDREVDVQAPPNVSNLSGTPLFEPRRVKIRAPQYLFSAATSTVVVYADIAASGTLDKPGSHDITVRVTSPQISGDGVSIIPPLVKASIEVRQADEKYTIRSIAIFVDGPRNLLERYKVVCPDTIANITVIGPSDQIAMLREIDATKPKAVLEVSRDDLPAGTSHTGRLRFLFPDKVEGVRVGEDSQRTVDYKLVDINGGAGE